ncbi:UNKNOWN [Stylonychia lemnae]|uniref:Uncharacterized protein n=1 Tax=Stylonychia lemnae TaxID=5949 RepID=A0A078AHW2_STYLE|nr:UNKNOWN [Stylonychia lemnae]|eukprot:CDW81097.1 UNKNOWN [Stylonychia lemnae]
MAYILANDKILKELNTEFYLIYGDKTHTENLYNHDKQEGRMGKISFAWNWINDMYRSKLREKIFIKYFYTKLFKWRKYNYDHNKGLKPEGQYDIELKDFFGSINLLIEGHEATKYFRESCPHVKYIHGEVPFIHGFGNKIGHCEVDSPELKSLRADYYVMCSSQYSIQVFRYIRHIIPMIRYSTELLSKSLNSDKKEALSRQCLIGKYSFLVPDAAPVLGKCFRYKNLYLNFGCQDHRIETYIRNAELIRDELLKDLGHNKDKDLTDRSQPQNPNLQANYLFYSKRDRVRNFKNRQQKSSYNIIQNREFQTPQNADQDLEQLKLNPSKSTCIIKFTKPAVISGLSKKLVFDETEYLKTPDIKRQSSQAPKGKRISLLSRTDSMTQLLRGDKKISPVREVSTEREMRIHRYTDSSLMRETINEYRDNDKTFGVVNTKSVTRDKININVDFQVCRQNLWKIIPSPMKYTVGNQTHYLQ